MSSFGYANVTYWKVGCFPIIPKKVRRFTNRKQSGKFNYPETQEVSGILEKTEHPRGESIQRLSWDGCEKKLQEPEQGKICGIICQHDFSPLLVAVAGLIIFTPSFPWLLLCRKQRQMKFLLHRSKTRERGNPARDLETYMMHRQFSHRTLLAHGLLHKLNFQRWEEASQITLGWTTSPVRVPGQLLPASHVVRMLWVLTILKHLAYRTKKKMVISCWNNRPTYIWISAAREKHVSGLPDELMSY